MTPKTRAIVAALRRLPNLDELAEAPPRKLVQLGAQVRGLVDFDVDVIPDPFAARPATEEELEIAQRLAARLAADGSLPPLTPAEARALEVLLLLAARPALLIQGGVVTGSTENWKEIAETREAFSANVIPAVGRLARMGEGGAVPMGTGFLVGPRRVLTNNHMAVLLAGGLQKELWRNDPAAFRDLVRDANDRWEADPATRPEFDRRGELGSDAQERSFVRSVEWSHPTADIAVLRLSQPLNDVPVLKLADTPVFPIPDRKVAIIGYPMSPPGGSAASHVQQIFGGNAELEVKRLSPALLKLPTAAGLLPHDGSTLGGSSGSAMVDFATGEVLGVHAAGTSVVNTGVPAWIHRARILDGSGSAF